MHLKYAVEVAKAGSINKASEALMMGQPNLSRAIRELESDLGISIFDRSAKGMVPTQDGAEFLDHARQILQQIDQVEAIYKSGVPKRQKFSIVVPHASYMSQAFARFSCQLSKDSAEIHYKETPALQAVEDVVHGDFKLGIIRYAASQDKFFKNLLEEKGLLYEILAEPHLVAVVSQDSPLSSYTFIEPEDVQPLIEICSADPSACPAFSDKQTPARRIFAYDRATQMTLLHQNPQTFLWTSSLPQSTMERYHLVQLACTHPALSFRDVLIHRRDYHLSSLDNAFITALCQQKRKCL